MPPGSYKSRDILSSAGLCMGRIPMTAMFCGNFTGSEAPAGVRPSPKQENVETLHLHEGDWIQSHDKLQVNANGNWGFEGKFDCYVRYSVQGLFSS